MPKFYVESGTVRCIVSAENSQSAALWAVHRVMQQVMPLDEPVDRTPESKDEQARSTGVMVLGATIRTSERGYGSAEHRQHATFEVVTQWNQLVSTLDRLENLLGRV